MGYISNVLGDGRIESIKLANSEEFKSEGRQLSSQESIKPIKPQVDFCDLEFAYKTDAINFNAINKSVQMIMSGGFKNFLHTKANVVKKFKEFFENIGEIGNDITFNELLESLFRDEMIYGNSFVEKIFNTDDDKIVDLAVVDPKIIDYAKTSDGRIILDENSKPIGYTIKFDNWTTAEGDRIPKKYESLIHKENNSIFLLYKRIAHFKLYPVGDKFYGIGLIAPSYISGIYKKNIQKGQANSIYQRGFNPLIGYIGSERRMATPNDIKNFLEEIKKLDYQRYLALPDWVKVEAVQYEQTGVIGDALKDLTTDQITSLSAPQALVSGSGEATNRATLGDQRVLWEFTLKDIIKQTMSKFKKEILKPINDYNQYGGVPETEWGELRAEDIEQTADKIIRILTSKSSNITSEFRDDLEEDLRQVMNIKESPNRGKYTTIQEKQQKEIEKKKKQEEKKDKDVEDKLSKINTKLIENLNQIKKLEDEKLNLENNYKEEIKKLKENQDLEKQKDILEKNKELENKINKLAEDANNKISERDKLISKLGNQLNGIKEDKESTDEKLNQLIEEKKLKVLERKENLIKKLEKDLENGK